MKEEEILQLWKSGYSKHKVAEMYRTNYNNRIKIIRLDIRNRNVNFITKYDALKRVEKIIYEYVRKK